MGIFDLFKKTTAPVEEKALGDISISEYNDQVAALLGVTDGAPVQVLPREAYRLSERNDSIGNAVSMIAESISELKKGLQTPHGDIDYSHPVIELLDNPGGQLSGAQFWREIGESFLLTEEGWFVGRGSINRPPLQLDFIRPYDVDIIMDETSGTPSLIMTRSKKDRRTYKRTLINRRIRYIDTTGLNEIFPCIGAISIVDEWRGRSRLVKLYYDALMGTDGKRHNVSLLKNGMRTSKAIMPKATGDNQNINPDGMKGLQNKIRTFHQGAGNAGNVFTSSIPLDIKDMSVSNKDMDYATLLDKSQIAIYNLYRIPLPLILPNAMTLDNYREANRVYYSKAVSPNFTRLANSILYNLAPRMDIPAGSTMAFSEVAIRDLKEALVDSMERLRKTQAVSTNEIRAVGGFEPDPGSDAILVNASLVPLSAVGGQSFADIPDDQVDE